MTTAWNADGKAIGMMSDGIGDADPPAGPVAAPCAPPPSALPNVAATGHIFSSNSLIDTNANPTELSAIPYGMNSLSPCFIAPHV